MSHSEGQRDSQPGQPHQNDLTQAQSATSAFFFLFLQDTTAEVFVCGVPSGWHVCLAEREEKKRKMVCKSGTKYSFTCFSAFFFFIEHTSASHINAPGLIYF